MCAGMFNARPVAGERCGAITKLTTFTAPNSITPSHDRVDSSTGGHTGPVFGSPSALSPSRMYEGGLLAMGSQNMPVRIRSSQPW